MTEQQLPVNERERLLRLIAKATAERQPLPEVLADDGSPGARSLATGLSEGKPLSECFGQLWPGRVWNLVTDGPIPLDSRVLLLAEEERARHDLRGLFLHSLMYPLTVCIASVVLALNLPTGLQALNWGWLLVGLVSMAVLSLAIPLWSLLRNSPRPGLLAWRWHAHRSQLFERLAAAATWRADETTLEQLFGKEILPLTPWMVGDGAEERCHIQARHHRDAARRSLRTLLIAMILGFHLMAGAGYLAVVEPAVQDFWEKTNAAFAID